MAGSSRLCRQNTWPIRQRCPDRARIAARSCFRAAFLLPFGQVAFAAQCASPQSSVETVMRRRLQPHVTRGSTDCRPPTSASARSLSPGEKERTGIWLGWQDFGAGHGALIPTAAQSDQPRCGATDNTARQPEHRGRYPAASRKTRKPASWRAFCVLAGVAGFEPTNGGIKTRPGP